jgi:signal transduction histidine kinase
MQLSVSNRLLKAENFGREVEQRVEQLVRDCYRDPSLPKLVEDIPFPLERATRFRALSEQFRKRHPILDQFFVFEDGRIGYPVLYTLGRGLPPNGGRCVEMILDGETQELVLARTGRALELYRGCLVVANSNQWKALALLRIARCLRKLGKAAESAVICNDIARKYGDLYDPFDRPYALVAGLKSNRADMLPSLYSTLLSGHWETSAEVFEYYQDKLENRLKISEAGQSRYRDHFRIAQELKESLRRTASAQLGEVYSQALRAPAQAFYTVPEGKHMLAMTVDLKWIQAQLLPTMYSKGVDVVAAGGPHSQASTADVPFKTLFPFWRLRVSGTEKLPNRDELVFEGVIALVMFVLVMGVVLLSRDLWRQAEVTRLRSEFVNAASHELKTPVTAIKLYADILMETPSLNDREAKHFYKVISNQTERLGQLIDRVLTFSRIDRGSQQYKFENGDLAGTIKAIVDSHQEYFSKRQVVVRANIPTPGPLARFDREAVTQAVLNLLDNAAKYSGSSPVIDVDVGFANRAVVFEVKDSGIGVRSDERSKIFDAFYRGAATPGTGGYGLGLFVVRQIMDAHKGTIEVESDPDGGSRFRLVFPCTES